MSECERREAQGESVKRSAKAAWAIATVQGILDNDFYIGTLRQSKYTRRKINGSDVKRDASDHLVFERHHQAVIDYRTFATTRALRQQRTTSHYRGVKINDNVYSGFLECGDCGSPMFAMSRRELRPAYTCGTYHRRGLSGCTSHHIRVDMLDDLLKGYIRKVRDNSAAMLERLNADLTREQEDVAETERTVENLEQLLLDAQEELKATKRQRIRDIAKHPEQESILDSTYDDLEADLVRRIANLQNQIHLAADKRNTIIRVNRAAKTAMEVFDDLLHKEHLDRSDLQLIIDKIKVYEDHLEVWLKADIDTLLHCGTLPNENAPVAVEGDVIAFSESTEARSAALVQQTSNRPDKIFRVNVISNGDPLEIYTTREGEVIFKKYSLIGGLEDFAAQFCDTLSRSTDFTAAVTDRDAVIAVAGPGKRELLGKSVSDQLEKIMAERSLYHFTGLGAMPRVCGDNETFTAAVAAPVLCEGDVLGAVLFVTDSGRLAGDTECKLAQTVAAFLGKNMES